MNILFLTLVDFDTIEQHNIYTDLLRELRRNGHTIYSVSPVEKRKKQKTYVISEENSFILKLKIGNIQKTNIIEKGISTLTIESLYIAGIKKYFSNIKFDMVLYSTPPITFCRAVEYVKRRDDAKTYLLLKDIFPQNSVDMGMLSKNGWKGVLYRYFRKKEKKLYQISDKIGCMSQANVDYVLKNNQELAERDRQARENGENPIIEINPNCIEVRDRSIDDNEKIEIRKKYELPLDKTIFLYGGNLGKPQGIEFLIQCIKSQSKNKDVFFMVVGDGTEYGKLEQFQKKEQQQNFKLFQRLPKEDYQKVVASCDIGMIFLDYRFTIPNFPSRILDYMAAKLPVLACTDMNTDIGKVITDGRFGWWCESNNVEHFEKLISEVIRTNRNEMKENSFNYLINNYSVERGAGIIEK